MRKFEKPFEVEVIPSSFSESTYTWLRNYQEHAEIINAIRSQFSIEDKMVAIDVSYAELLDYLATLKKRLIDILYSFLEMDLVDTANGEPVDWDIIISMTTPYKTKRQLIANLKHANVNYEHMLELRNTIVDEFEEKEVAS